jgi:hypothetical protein
MTGEWIAAAKEKAGRLDSFRCKVAIAAYREEAG